MSKRGNGEGYIYQNSRGLWIVRMQIGWLDNGNPRFKSFTGHTRKEALEKKREYDQQSKALTCVDNCTLTVAMNNWLVSKKKLSLKPSSYARLEITVQKNILPRIGRYYVSEMTSDLIQHKVISDMTNAGLSWSTIKKCRDALNDFYRQLITERKIVFNPVTGVIMPSKHLFSVKQTRALNPDEIERFEKICSSTYENGKPVYRHGFGYIFILNTGIRSGEALGLQYKHINLKAQTLKVEQSLVCVDSSDDENVSSCTPILQDSTKTISGQRVIPLTDKAVDAMEKHMTLHYTGNDEDFVFASNAGDPLLYRNFRRSVNAVYKAAGVDASGFHILRHTMATRMFENGIDIKYISKYLGHSGVQITYDSYVHTNSAFSEDVINKMNLI